MKDFCFRRFAEVLDVMENPNIFGLHENGAIASLQRESQDLLEPLVSMQPTAAGGSSGTTDELVISVVDTLLSQLKSRIVLDEDSLSHLVSAKLCSRSTSTQVAKAIVHPLRPSKRDVVEKVHPFTTFILLEAHRFNALRTTVLEHLQELKRAIRGEVLMSEFLESLYNNVVFSRVPPVWVSASYPTLKPLGAWVSDLKLRMEFISSWLSRGHGLGNEGASSSLGMEPLQSYWLGGLFFPQGFLTAVLQAHSRAHDLPVDSLTLKTTVMKIESGANVRKGPEEGVYVHGLFLDGGRW
mmetsp:Transcript_48507/g.125864  ORF Transcript_48507/g.125864 Transcript_48507/m.125864 type:complete len:297 (-) Transcript_48507:725-1615(-)